MIVPQYPSHQSLNPRNPRFRHHRNPITKIEHAAFMPRIFRWSGISPAYTPDSCRWSGISPAWRGINPAAISPTQMPKSLRHQHSTALEQRPNLTCRQLDLLLLTIHQNPPSLQVRLELTLRSVHRVATVVPELRLRTRTKFEGGSDLLFGHGHGVRFRLHGFRMSQQRLG